MAPGYEDSEKLQRDQVVAGLLGAVRRPERRRGLDALFHSYCTLFCSPLHIPMI